MIQSVMFRTNRSGITRLIAEHPGVCKVHRYLWDELGLGDEFKSLDEIVRDLTAHMIQCEDIPPNIPDILQSLATLSVLGCVEHQIEEVRKTQVVPELSYIVWEHGTKIKDDHAFDKGEDS